MWSQLTSKGDAVTKACIVFELCIPTYPLCPIPCLLHCYSYRPTITLRSTTVSPTSSSSTLGIRTLYIPYSYWGRTIYIPWRGSRLVMRGWADAWDGQSSYNVYQSLVDCSLMLLAYRLIALILID